MGKELDGESSAVFRTLRSEQFALLRRMLMWDEESVEEENEELSEYCAFPSSLVIVYGHAHTGKTTVVREVLEQHCVRSGGGNGVGSSKLLAIVNGAEIHHARNLFTEILHQIFPSSSEDRFGNFPEFLIGFKKHLRMRTEDTELRPARALYIVLDHVDRMLNRTMATTLRSLLKLNEMTDFDCSVCFVLITRGLSGTLRDICKPFLPSYVHFSNYTSEQVLLLLHSAFSDSPFECIKSHAKWFSKWLKYVHSLIEHECTDWTETLYICEKVLPIFDQFVQFHNDSTEDKESEVNLRRLYKASESYVFVLLKNLFRHSLSASDLNQQVHTHHTQLKHQRRMKLTTLRSKEDHRVSEFIPFLPSSPAQAATYNSQTRVNDPMGDQSLPWKTSVLMIATYLASYNPSNMDTTYFSSGTELNKRKKRRGVAKSSKVTTGHQQLLGPRCFRFGRLFAIYCSLLAEHDQQLYDDDAENDAEEGILREKVFQQLDTLIQMQIVVRVTSIEELDVIQYRCQVDSEYVYHVAAQVRIPINRYLFQPGT